MKLYIATKWGNSPRAIEVAAMLEAAGNTITYKWWEAEAMSLQQALSDFNGVIHADALVLIVEDDLPYSGALTEFGIALARFKPVYVLGHAQDRNIFMLLPGVYRGIEPLLNPAHEIRA
jgi:nucleoside 2-deoxyribosyltransferase